MKQGAGCVRACTRTVLKGFGSGLSRLKRFSGLGNGCRQGVQVRREAVIESFVRLGVGAHGGAEP